MSEPAYKHTQKSSLMQVLFLALGVVFFGLAILGEMPWILRALYILLSTMMIVLAFVFSTLTVIIDATHLKWHFGLGFWKKSVAISEIDTSEVVRTKWWYGWGIRGTPRGWLYNVAGLDAIEVQLKNGRAFLIGTDMPDALHAALQKRVR